MPSPSLPYRSHGRLWVGPEKAWGDMSDYEQMKAMFRKAGINFSEIGPAEVDKRWDERTHRELLIEAKDGEHNAGYQGFVSYFGFSDLGDLLWVGMWE